METNVYWMWLLSMGSLIFLMQAGFFLLEGGQVSSRDVSNVLMKMTGHVGVGIVVFILGGFAIKQYGWPLFSMPNGWLAPWQFVTEGEHAIGFFISVVFALVSCAIPSGSFSGRMRFSAYLWFAGLYVGVVYPVFAYLLWNGPLARLGVQDYAGSLGVHAVGGITGLVGARFLGPRQVRSGAHDVPMMGLGALLLMFCWFGFNLGSVPGYKNVAADLPLVAINTLAAIAGGVLGSLVASARFHGKSSPIITPNGGLAGAVVICSGVHLVHPLFAVCIGALAGIQIPYTSKWLAERLKLDDPCDVGAVHAIPGLMGGLAVALWAPMMPHGFHGYTIHVWPQIFAVLFAIVFALVAGAAMFALIDRIAGLRVNHEEELSGLDMSVHGIPAYPEFLADTNDAPTILHVLSGVRVSEVMTEPVAVSPLDSLEAVQEIMLAKEFFALPVLDEDNELCGIVAMADLQKIHRSERPNVSVAAVYTHGAQVVFPDQTVHEVIERMRDQRLANFPVVSRKNDRVLLGMVAKTDLIRAYRDHALAVTA